MLKNRTTGSVLGLCFLTAAIPFALAEEESRQPYIEQLKKQLDSGSPPDSGSSYTEEMKRRLQNDQPTQDARGYTEELRSRLKEAAPADSPSYTQSLKATIPPKETEGAIQAVHEGRSELRPRYEGLAKHTVAFRYGASIQRNLTGNGNVVRSNFSSVYGGNYAPDVGLLYEYRPSHIPVLNGFGLAFLLGFSYFHGNGIFAQPIPKPDNSGNYPLESNTAFKMYQFSGALAPRYTINLTRYFKPHILAGPMALGLLETRDDDEPSKRAYGFGYVVSGGVSLSLDWISPSSAWDLYAHHGIRNFLLNIDYSWMSTVGSQVQFRSNGLVAGLGIEF